jgi:hypothetical protein
MPVAWNPASTFLLCPFHPNSLKTVATYYLLGFFNTEFRIEADEIACWDVANLRFGIKEVEPADSLMLITNWSTFH